jgi:hypothetical protein
VAESLTLQQELAANRQALSDLTGEIAKLSDRIDAQADAVRIERRWRRALMGVTGMVLALGLFVIGFAWNTRSDLREFGERLFLNSCADVNESRANSNEGRTQQAEILIKLFNADEIRPELAEQYRQLTRDLNDQFPQRDCDAELEGAG